MENTRIEIRPAGEKGKGLFSAVHMNKGDVVFEEEPLVSCQFAWNEDYGYSACDECLRPLETAEENARRLAMNDSLRIPYPEQCSVDKSKHTSCPSCNVKYCSTKCKDMAWRKYHKTLCLHKFERDKSHPLEILKEAWKEMHYPMETSTIMLFARIFALVNQAEDKDSVLNTIKQFCHPSLTEDECSYKLVGLKFSDQLNILRELIVKSVPTEHAQEWTTPEGFRSLIGLVGMNGQGIGTSAVSDWVKNIEKLKLPHGEKEACEKYIDKLYEDFENAVGEFLNNEGSGLYCMQSTINHSCRPNAEVAFPNSNYRLVVRCIQDVSPDEEICISYLDECVLERSRHSRQKILLSNYFFACKCPKCEEEIDEIDETSSEDMDEDSDAD